MNKIIEKLKGKIIVSCQSSSGEPLYEDNCMPAMAASVINGGAAGLRLAGVKDIKAIRNLTNIPIIGITKPDPLPVNWKDVVYITPTYHDAKIIAEAGADIVAFDGTSRKRPAESLQKMINQIHNDLNVLTMADIATLEEAVTARQYGVDIISTTLAGYTTDTLSKDNGEPDFHLLEGLVKTLDCPIILEGRIWTQEHVKKAFDYGAFAVVIGSAITRPQLITKRFVQALGDLK